MSKAKNIWFPFYVQDFLHGTRRMKPEEIGAYILLICEYWEVGPLKNDKKYLRSICKISEYKFEKISEIFLKKFEEKDGFLYHDRVDSERDKALNLQKKQSKGGKSTAAKYRAAKTPAKTALRASDSDSDCPLRVTTNLTTTPKGDTTETEPPELTLVTADSEGW